MLNLSELKAARAKMEPGPYAHVSPEPPAGSVDISGSRCCCPDAPEADAGVCPKHEHIAEWVPLDTAIGIEATHAAADTLIDIAEAALAHVRALDAASDERRAMRLSDDEQLGRASAAMVRLSQTEASLRSALSAVKP